jgi:hypothetical protein
MLNQATLHHAFSDSPEGVSATFGRRRTDGSGNNPPDAQTGSEAVVLMEWPHDPVLRQALIDTGVLSVADLENAERKIRSITGQVMSDGQRQGG